MNLRLVLINAAFLVTVPGVVAGCMPLLVVYLVGDRTHVSLGAFRYVGMAVMLIAGAVYARCAIELARRGHGVPAPVAPTRVMVHTGLYRYVRNPMYLTGSIFIYAEAVAFEHLIILAYAAIVSLLQHLGVVFLEEPALRERFGESFQRYCDEVPRWLPRLRPATANSGAE